MTKELNSNFKEIPTPFYYYDIDLLRNTLDALKLEADKYGYHVHYAFKANSNKRILSEIKQKGLGADCVSGNEVKKAIELGFDSSDIVLAGVGKTDDEINFSLDHDIFCFNCESIQELEVINELANAKNKTANIALRINPNVNANTHKHITTGLEENKFGINLSEIDDALEVVQKSSNLNLIGLHFHIGSQITDLSSFKNLCSRVNEIQQKFISRGIILEHINVGGGLGINYHEPDQEPIVDFKSYFRLFNEFLELRPKQQLHFELGRSVTGNCGSLISRVLYIKKRTATNFAILDAGMTELIRPALYQSFHKIQNLSKSEETKLEEYDVVGPICETTDCFGKHVSLPHTERGDIIMIRSAGAYGQIMASEYNLRNKAAAIYSDDLVTA